jgi:myo-inositol-1(or 4)-monophosphatase
MSQQNQVQPLPPAAAPTAFDGVNPCLVEDTALLPAVVGAVVAAGASILERFSPLGNRPDGLEAVIAAIHANDEVSVRHMRAPLRSARPTAGWVDDELATGPLPAGEWWVPDVLEGNINHIHGMRDWSVTATLVRDNKPVLTAVHVPLTGETFTAVQGGGAMLDGQRLHPSAKSELKGAFVATGQARPGEDTATFERMGVSLTAMLNSVLLARVSVPATTQLAHVAAGQIDAFWQYSDVRSGLLAGALLVAEAGGMVTDTRGRPWSLASEDILAATPALHHDLVNVLATAR